MTKDEAKDLILDTCKTSMQMDLHEMGRGLEKWGFRVVDYERLSDPDPATLQEFMVWLECSYGVELMKRNVINWLEGMSRWPWVGHWCFVTKYHIPNQPNAEWTFEIVKFLQGGWSVRKTDAVPKWPDGLRRGRL